jgi:hypothetical protein
VLLTNAADRVSAGLVLGGFVCTLVALFGGGRVPNPRRRRNPKKPKHLGDVVARWKKRGPVVAKRRDQLEAVLDRLDRQIDIGGKGVHIAYARRTLVKKAWKRAHNVFQGEAAAYNNALHEAEAKYDQDPARSWRPIKNPKPKHLGATLRASDAKIEALLKRRAALREMLARCYRLGGHRGRRIRDLLDRVDSRLRDEAWKQKLAKGMAEAAYDAERAHRPIKKNPWHPSPKAARAAAFWEAAKKHRRLDAAWDRAIDAKLAAKRAGKPYAELEKKARRLQARVEVSLAAFLAMKGPDTE